MSGHCSKCGQTGGCDCNKPPSKGLANNLSPLEIELLTGASTGWGSWMFGVGHDLVRKGLGREYSGSIYFDTPACDEARAAIATIQKQES